MQRAGGKDGRAFLTRAVIVIVGALYVLYAASSVSGASTPEGMQLPLFAIALALAPVAVFLAFRYPLVFPFGLYVALIPFDNILRVGSGASYVRLIAIVSALALIARMVLVRRFVFPKQGWYAWAALVAWAGLTFLWTPDLPESQRIYGIVIQNFLILTVLAVYPVEESEFHGITAITILGGIGTALYAIFSHGYDGGRLTLIGAGGISADPNQFATSFILPIGLALAIGLATRTTLLRIACFAGVALMLVGILMTASRGGVVAVAVLLIYFAFRSRHRIQIFAVGAASIAMTAFFPTVWGRFVHDEGALGSGSGRTFIWEVGWRAIKEHWLVGTGIGSFPETYDANFLAVFQQQLQGWHRPSHNIIVGSWVELGIIGLAVVLWAWFRSFRQLSAIPKNHRFYPLRIALEASIVGLFAQSLFIDPIWIKYIWLAQSFPLLLLNLYQPRGVDSTAQATANKTGARIVRPVRV
jgi:O-antigen ligase